MTGHKFYRDVDYYLYFLDFPHPGVYGTAAANTDGTVNIYINTLYNEKIQVRTIKHELRHMAKGHLWDDLKPVTEKELEADDKTGCRIGRGFSYVEYIPEPPFVNVFAACGPGEIPCFRSLAALHRYYLRAVKHYEEEEAAHGKKEIEKADPRPELQLETGDRRHQGQA